MPRNLIFQSGRELILVPDFQELPVEKQMLYKWAETRLACQTHEGFASLSYYNHYRGQKGAVISTREMKQRIPAPRVKALDNFMDALRKVDSVKQ